MLENYNPVRDQFIPYGKQYIDDDDIAAVSNVLRSPYITTGPQVDLLESSLCEITTAKYAVAVSNGTAALHTACYAAGITQGDEVIVTPMTFAASANCILYCGGTPVFADINPDTWNIDVNDIRRKITARTKAVIAVDFTGQAVDLDPIKKLCEEHGLLLIEDAAHSLGTKYNGKPVGSIADLTTFSFHPVKAVTAGEGGAILTNDPCLYQKLKLFRSHGITRDAMLLSQTPYNGYNEQIDLGYNYRLTDFQAALCNSQLKKLNMFSARRKQIVNMYNEAFLKMPEIIVQKEIAASDTTRHIYIIRLNRSLLSCSRDEFYAHLNSENVGLQVHYIPVYYHPYYQKLGYKKGICPVAESVYEDIITIPLFYSLTDSDVDSVIRAVAKTISKFN